jgi:plastocyanin domain-containing protein
MQRTIFFLTVLLMAFSGAAFADDDVQHIPLTIQNHVYTPAEIHIPAGKPAILDVENKDPMAEEFDSSALQIEKVIPGGRKGIVRIKPLDAGHYPFIGEYHSDTAKGVLIAE